MNTFFLDATDGLKLSIAHFDCNNPKAIVQMIHGAAEHKGRYYEFAQFLNDNQYTVLVSDNRGHGLSVNTLYPLGYMDSFQKIIDDQYLISQYFRALYPQKQLILLGHSLGSIFARIYLEKHDDEIHKLVLSGTVPYFPPTTVALSLARTITKIEGKDAHSTLLRTLAMNGKDSRWLSKSKKNRENYSKDPLCGFAYPNESILTLFEAVKERKETAHFECKNPSLPIMRISGEDDPVTGGKIGLKETFKLLQEIGYREFVNNVYIGMRHEVLNEEDCQIVYKDVLNFISSDY